MRRPGPAGILTPHQRVKPNNTAATAAGRALRAPRTAFPVNTSKQCSRYVHNLRRKNANLRRTRDLLLPKLISGALDVSKLDIETTSQP